MTWAAQLLTRLLLAWVVFLLPGVAASAVLVRRRPIATVLAHGGVAVASGLVALVSFFAWLAAPVLGRAFTWVVLIASAGVLVERHLHRGARERVGRRVARERVGGRGAPSSARSDTAAALLLMVAIGAVSLGAFAAHAERTSFGPSAEHRYLGLTLPTDNLLPFFLADRVERGADLDPFVGDWQSSDRPPLQAGAYAFMHALPWRGRGDVRTQTQGTALGMLAIPALWDLLRALGLGRRRVAGTVLAASLCGTTILYGGYVWPKLLSAAFVLEAAAVAVWWARRTGPGVDGEQVAAGPVTDATGVGTSATPHGSGWPLLLAGAAFGCALMAHTGAAFVGLPLAGVVARSASRGRPTRARIATPVYLGAAALVCLPWTLYQRYAAPPGDRLLKWHLAGVVAPDSRPFLRTLREAYGALSWRDVAHLKTTNLRALVLARSFGADVVGLRPGRLAWAEGFGMRQREFLTLSASAGVWWWALPAFALASLWRATRRGGGTHRRGNGLRSTAVPLDGPRIGHDRHVAERVAAQLGASVCVVAITWCMAMFGPSATIPHQGSTALVLVLVSALAVAASAVDERLLWFGLLAAGVRTWQVWVAAAAPVGTVFDGDGFLLARWGGTAVVVWAVLVIAAFGRVAREDGTR